MLAYQTCGAVIKAELSGYIPVGVILDDGHIGELDWRTKMVKLQLQTRGFLPNVRFWDETMPLTHIREKNTLLRERRSKFNREVATISITGGDVRSHPTRLASAEDWADLVGV